MDKVQRAFHVNLIVLTHGHMDHCENTDYLANALHIPIAMNKKDMDLIPNNKKQPLYANTFLGMESQRETGSGYCSITAEKLSPGSAKSRIRAVMKGLLRSSIMLFRKANKLTLKNVSSIKLVNYT